MANPQQPSNRLTAAASSLVNQVRDKANETVGSLKKIPGLEGAISSMEAPLGMDRYHAPRRCQAHLLTAAKAHVHREVRPLPSRSGLFSLLGSFGTEMWKGDFSTAFGRLQAFWGATINVMGPNLRFGAEMMNPTMNAVSQFSGTVFGKGPDPMSKLALAIQESALNRPTPGPSIGIH